MPRSSRISAKQLAAAIGPARAAELGLSTSRSKFGVSKDPARRTRGDIIFASVGEARLYDWLMRHVSPDLFRLQLTFDILPRVEINDPFSGQYTQQEMRYKSDFVVGVGVHNLPDPVPVGMPLADFLILDFKGCRTQHFKLKKKIFQHVHGAPLIEVFRKFDQSKLINLINTHVSTCLSRVRPSSDHRRASRQGSGNSPSRVS